MFVCARNNGQHTTGKFGLARSVGGRKEGRDYEKWERERQKTGEGFCFTLVSLPLFFSAAQALTKSLR